MFEKLFAREEAKKNKAKKSARPETPKFAPNTKIAYKPELIPTLEKEHQDLLEVYKQASKAANAKLDKRTRKILCQFKDMFIDHILRENTSLYIYLQHSAHAETSKKSINLIKIEMEKIAREVIQFLDYGVKESTSIDDEFLHRMDEISIIMRKRIMYEEGHVYPNYLTKNSISKGHGDLLQT